MQKLPYFNIFQVTISSLLLIFFVYVMSFKNFFTGLLGLLISLILVYINITRLENASKSY